MEITTREGTFRYRKTAAERVPTDVRWTVPRRCQGQIVEAAWGRVGARTDSGPGDMYYRVADHSDGTVEHFRRVGGAR